MEIPPVLYWSYLVLAIIVSVCSLTYWTYKFVQWWQRRSRRRTRQERSRLEQQEKIAMLTEEREELLALAEEVSRELGAASLFWQPFQRRRLQAQLKRLRAQERQLASEIEQLEAQWASAEHAGARPAL